MNSFITIPRAKPKCIVCAHSLLAKLTESPAALPAPGLKWFWRLRELAAALADVCHALYKTKGARAATGFASAGAARDQNVGAIAGKRNAKNFPASDPSAPRSLWPEPRFTPNFWSAANCGASVIPRWDLRDGLLAQMAAEYDRSTRSGKQLESERWDSLLAAVAHYRVDMHHALQVRESAMYLFARFEVTPPVACRNTANGCPPPPCFMKSATM